MSDGKRLWRTADGSLVLDGDPSAVTLAYGAGDDVDKSDEAAAKKALAEPDNKKTDPASNKKSPAPRNKSRG